MTTDAPDDIPPHRYDAALADQIERKWQERWRERGTYETPNPVGELSSGFDKVADKPKLFVMDMFPYPSGSGLHVGHPLGYIGTDVYARFMRMTGRNVLHTMGYDAFGLPAEEHARQTGQHPRENTEANIANMRSQLARLGLGHDARREIATTDVGYYRWTQWIFLQIYNSWYDRERAVARPISELVDEFASGKRALDDGRVWAELDAAGRNDVLNGYRLAYLDEAPVNWCPALGTVLANEEVTAEGRSERGNHPVFKRPLKQWKMRITEYADRLIEDLDHIDWFESVKAMQRNWIGRSEGANVGFPAGATTIEVFTTRPDTLFGATYMVLAPEHPLVDELVATNWPDGTKDAWTGGHDAPATAVAVYRELAASKTDLDRQAEGREKTGVFTGAFAENPVNGAQIPIFIADYVLMGYGTGAIMAVPGQDERDWEFAEIFELPIIRTVQPPEDFEGDAYAGDGPAINSDFLDGMGVEDAKRTMISSLEDKGVGEGTITYKLRDWLFSRQRYWGEPFPIVYDEAGDAHGLPEEMLPVQLPELIDWAPRALDENSEPEPPLGRAEEWATLELDLGDGPQTYRRELNTMPQWAGSCWYYLRYIDPTNTEVVADPETERYWMTDADGGIGGVDLYVGGVEHAVLHLLYARFWHKVLFDLGHVSGPEPFQRLFNQGYIQAAAFQDSRGVYVDATAIEERDGEFFHEGQPVTRSFGKMGKSLKNSVTPDEMYAQFGADTLRLYEMFMGPLDQDRPWETRSVTGSMRLLQRVWRNLVDEDTGEVTVNDDEPSEDLLRVLHRTIEAVASDMDGLRFNTAIARITELNNELTKLEGPTPRTIADPLVRMLSPLVPHVAEELWERLDNKDSVVYATFPEADPKYLVEDTIELPVHVNGKMRSSISVSSDASEKTIKEAALADPKVIERMDGKDVRKVIVVPGRLVNIVV